MGRFAFIALLIGCPCWAVEVEPLQKRDTPIVITHDMGQTVNAVFVDGGGKWTFLPDSHFRRGDTETVMAGPPGQYLITTGDSKIIEVAEEGRPEPNPRPDPKPTPDPKPDPKPEPNPKPDPPEPEPGPGPILASWVVFIEEQEERGTHIDAVGVMNDQGFRNSLADKGIKVRIYDDDLPEAKAFAKVAGDIRPAMILVESSEAYRVFPAPKTVEAAERIIRETVVR